MTEGVQQVWATEITSVSQTQLEVLGAIRFDATGKIYKYVKYTDGSGNLNMIVGDVVTWDEDSGPEAFLVTCDESDNGTAEIGAGVVQATVLLDADFIWIQIKGLATVAVTPEGSAADGEPLTATGAGDKALTRAKEADSTGVYKHVCAIAVDATAKIILCDFPW